MALKQSGFMIVRLSTIDWKLQNSVKYLGTLLKNKCYYEGLNFMVLYLTSLVYGIRRSLLIYAR